MSPIEPFLIWTFKYGYWFGPLTSVCAGLASGISVGHWMLLSKKDPTSRLVTFMKAATASEFLWSAFILALVTVGPCEVYYVWCLLYIPCAVLASMWSVNYGSSLTAYVALLICILLAPVFLVLKFYLIYTDQVTITMEEEE